jgi:hypothetical protein
MKKIYSILFIIVLLASSALAGDLATSFKQAVVLAETEDRDRTTRIYSEIDLRDYYQQKYMPVFQSCLKSTDHPDMSTFSFVAAIGSDGHVLRLYVDQETNIYRCVQKTLERDKFPQPPVSPYYMHMTMNFSK